MILIRTLRRAFEFRGCLPDECIAFLRTDPLLSSPPEQTDIVEIQSRYDGLWSMRCSWGLQAAGSARSMVRILDEAVYRLALFDEGPTLSLNATVFRLDGRRILLTAETGVDLCDMAIALIVQGVEYEGTSLVFVRSEGIVAHPVKPRVRSSRLPLIGLSSDDAGLSTLFLYDDGPTSAIDPRVAGAEWSIVKDTVPIILFAEQNTHGCSAISRIDPEAAFARLLRSARSAQRPKANSFIQLRLMIERAHTFRLSLGAASTAAPLIVAQLRSLDLRPLV